MKKGDIILISFPFTDLSGSKKSSSNYFSYISIRYNSCIHLNTIKMESRYRSAY